MRRVGQICGCILLVGLWLPTFQQVTQWWNVQPLHGDVPNPAAPSWSASGFLGGHFQHAVESWAKRHVGFQPDLVRTYNELHYRAFRVARANGVVIGQAPETGHPVLFENDYLLSYRGLDGVRPSEVDSAAARLASVHSRLKAHGIPLLIVIAPNKARFMPECLPEGPDAPKSTTYTRWREALLTRGIPYLDADSLLRAWRPSSPHPLFSPTGVHWTRYAALRFLPQLLDRYESVSGQKVASFTAGDLHVPGEARWGDDDIEQGMNLWSDLPDGPLAYGPYHWANLDSVSGPVFVSGDSFYWTLFNVGCSREGLGGGSFAFYHRAVYPESYASPVSEVNVLAQKGIILLFTDATFRKSLYPFLEDLEAQLGSIHEIQAPMQEHAR